MHPSLALFSATLTAIAVPVSANIYPVRMPSGFFAGPQSGIGSWYRANAASDDTKGISWCGFKYANSDPLFAVSLKAMGGATYGSNPTAWREQIRKYCGLEALVTDPSTGKSKLMYLGDAFDDAWVRTPASIDIMIDGFSALHGNPNGDKNKVINPVKWEFTGKINTQYTAEGAVWPTAATTASAPHVTSTACTGCLGAKCDGQATICNAGLTCLSPDGICSDKACNWGCTGWSCSASVPCQKPNKCISGVCKA
ncbi:hypothetical protein B0T10DRAFT_539018 [Thelonectria olida]|uniref:Uncharacterized protein n=1 Tax=Thelonectria olida TaxID=1576542 RepID=A0A9P8W4L6_9HYPO|nr:hypothetical protein B0T10DRAFT_539018 [Thelonectria olida]